MVPDSGDFMPRLCRGFELLGEFLQLESLRRSTAATVLLLGIKVPAHIVAA
jgi:hypothetical protein